MHAKFHNQGLTGSEFIKGGPFTHPRLFNVKKAQLGLMEKTAKWFDFYSL